MDPTSDWDGAEDPFVEDEDIPFAAKVFWYSLAAIITFVTGGVLLFGVGAGLEATAEFIGQFI